MSDYISREQAIKVVRGMRRSTGVKEIPYEYAEEEIGYLPSADVRENTHGEWIDTKSKDFETYNVYKCSICGNVEIEYPERIATFNFCPNCGADMRKGET